MKTRIFLLATLAFAAASCSKKVVLPEFGIAATDTLLQANGLSCCKVEYRFASILNAAASPSLGAIEQANVGYFFQLEEFTGTADEGAQASLREIAADYLSDGPGTVNGDYHISAEAQGTIVDTLLCYVITRSSYIGGAHGMYGTECHTYSIPGGYEIILADLFTEDRIAAIGASIRAKLYEQYDAKDDEQLAGAGFFPEYIGPTENFTISPKGDITFCYNPYDIGCYALGAVEVTLTRGELERL